MDFESYSCNEVATPNDTPVMSDTEDEEKIRSNNRTALVIDDYHTDISIEINSGGIIFDICGKSGFNDENI